MNASVVIPAKDAAATLARTLECLAAQETAPLEVLVADDESSDETAAIAARGGATLVPVPAGSGPAGARNAAAAKARGEVLAFTDADCFPEPGWLAAGLRAIEAGADLVQGRVWPDPEVAMGPFDRTVWVVEESGLYETANLFVRRELFERLGGFEVWLEPEVGKPLAEDVWLGWRARRAAADVRFEPTRSSTTPCSPAAPAPTSPSAAGCGISRRSRRRCPSCATRSSSAACS